jgi:hypothetical protein
MIAKGQIVDMKTLTGMTLAHVASA